MAFRIPRAATVAAAIATASASAQALDSSSHSRGVLSARAPHDAPHVAATAGLFALELGGARDGVLYVPKSYRDGKPMPLVVLLHGAGGTGRGMLGVLQHLADERGFLVLAPDSRDRRSWDVITDELGPDVAFLDRALALVFARYAVDPARVAIAGFSDGASYALTLGLSNGDLFRHVIAFSPGFVAHGDARGAPRVFIAHGTHDDVLNVDRCSRRIAPRLERAGYPVRYREFDGPHTVPGDIAREAIDWMLGR